MDLNTDRRMTESEKRNYINRSRRRKSVYVGKNKKKRYNPGKMGNPAVVKTYEDARENAMINRDVPTMKEGGYCRGAGAAIKGTKFEGVF